MERGSARASTFLPVLGVFCSVFFLTYGLSEAIEKWELPLGWNPQYGPRYVLFRDRRSGSKDLPLGTCTYGHYAATPQPTEQIAGTFLDFHILHLKRQGNPMLGNKSQRVSPLGKLVQFPFYQVPAPARYEQLKGSELPLESLNNVPAVLEAVKTFGGQLCLNYMRSLERASEQSTRTALIQSEVPRLLTVLRLLHLAMREAQNFDVDKQGPAVLKILEEAIQEIREVGSWDATSFSYWVEASNSATSSGTSYYVAELETARWEVATEAVALAKLTDTTYAYLKDRRTDFKDCYHFEVSNKSANLKGREYFCGDAFIALSRALVEKIKSLLEQFPEELRSVSDSLRNFEDAIRNSSFTMNAQSPFYAQPT